MKTVQETILPLLLSVYILRSVPRQLGEAVEIANNSLASLPKVATLVSHSLDQCRWNVHLLESFSELGPSKHLACWQMGENSFPLVPCGTGEVVRSIQHLLVVSNSNNSEVILDCPEPIFSIKLLLGL